MTTRVTERGGDRGQYCHLLGTLTPHKKTVNCQHGIMQILTATLQRVCQNVCYSKHGYDSVMPSCGGVRYSPRF
jgi:hypothetical protein